jgi:hypothetical protein
LWEAKSPSRDGQRRMLSEDTRDVEHSIEATEGNGRKATYTKSSPYRKGDRTSRVRDLDFLQHEHSVTICMKLGR